MYHMIYFETRNKGDSYMPRAIWILVIGMAINFTGASFLWPLNTIYLSQELGQSLTFAGIVLMFNGGANVIGNLLGGKLYDYIGGYKTIVLGVSITMVSAFLLVFFHSRLFAYIGLLIIIGFGSGIMVPCMYAMAGSVWPDGGRRPFNAMYVSQNVGVAAGSAIGGLLASYRFDFVFFGNGIMYLLFFVLAFCFFRNLPLNAGKVGITAVFEENIVEGNKKRMYALLLLSFGYLVCTLCYNQWSSTISVHTQSLGIPLQLYSILWTINGAMIVFCQPFIKFFIDRWFHSLKSQMIVGIIIFAASFLVLAQAKTFSFFVFSMVVITIGEMFVWPAVPTVASHLAPEGQEGFYQGIVNSFGAGGRLLGPVVGGFIADLYGMTVLFYVVVVMFLLPFITTLIYDRRLHDSITEKKAVSNE